MGGILALGMGYLGVPKVVGEVFVGSRWSILPILARSAPKQPPKCEFGSPGGTFDPTPKDLVWAQARIGNP